MSKPSPDFEQLIEAITPGEIDMVKAAVELFQKAGVQVDIAKFIDDFMQDLGYEWSDFWDGYERKEHGESFEKREVRKAQTVHTFFKKLQGERTLEQFWTVRPDHEVYYAIHTYNYLSRKGQRISPVVYLDQVAQFSGCTWVAEEKKYQSIPTLQTNA